MLNQYLSFKTSHNKKLSLMAIFMASSILLFGTGCAHNATSEKLLDVELLAKQKISLQSSITQIESATNEFNLKLAALKQQLTLAKHDNKKEYKRLAEKYQLADKSIKNSKKFVRALQKIVKAKAMLQNSKNNQEMQDLLDGFKYTKRYTDALTSNFDSIDDYLDLFLKTANSQVKWQNFKLHYQIDNTVKAEIKGFDREAYAENSLYNSDISEAVAYLKEAEQHFTQALSCCQQKVKQIEALWQQDKIENDRDKNKSAKRKAKLKRLLGKFVDIPSGQFIMGAPKGSYEKRPMHPVKIRAFKLQEHELTWQQYTPCVASGACEMPDDKGFGKGNRPVLNVSWQDATQYIYWLNRQGIGSYRLPTEAEWEYAAKAGTSTKYSWGDTIDCSKARYGYYQKVCGRQKSTDPVKSFSPNPWGLYDMNGNVWELVNDCWNDNYHDAPRYGRSRLRDRFNQYSSQCKHRIIRGGAWYSDAQEVSSADRGHSGYQDRFDAGFRLVLDIGSSY